MFAAPCHSIFRVKCLLCSDLNLFLRSGDIGESRPVKYTTVNAYLHVTVLEQHINPSECPKETLLAASVAYLLYILSSTTNNIDSEWLIRLLGFEIFIPGMDEHIKRCTHTCLDSFSYVRLSRTCCQKSSSCSAHVTSHRIHSEPYNFVRPYGFWGSEALQCDFLRPVSYTDGIAAFGNEV